MNGLTKKLFISILSLIIAVLIFGTVTYAWFSIATTNIVHNISLGISSGDKFQISLDGINYSKTIPSEDILKAIGNKLDLKDVTTTNGIDFSKGGPEEKEEAVANVDYISLTFYFRTSGYERNVYLVENVSQLARFEENVEGTYVISKGINWKADVTFRNGINPTEDIVNVGERDVYYAANAVRVGFVEEKIVENVLDVREEEQLTRKIFDLSDNEIRGYGTSFGSLDYYNVKHNKDIQPPALIPETVTKLSEFDEYVPYIPLDDNSKILELIKTNSRNESGDYYYQGRVKINIWIEGWDADCFNAILRDSLMIQLKFKSARELEQSNYKIGI